jgi:hypothetical protein
LYQEFDIGIFMENAERPNSIEKQFMDLISKCNCGELIEVDEVFRSEGTERALEFCLNSGIWDMALILAGTISDEEYSRVCTEVLNKRMGASSFLASSLRVAEGRADYVRDWKTILITSLQSYGDEAIQTLRETKTLLEIDGSMDAAEIVGIFIPPEDA